MDFILFCFILFYVWSFLTTSFVGVRFTSHGSQVPNPVSLEVNPCIVSCWEHGSWDLPLQTRSRVWNACSHGNTFWRRSSKLVVRVGSSKKTRPNSQHKSCGIFAQSNQDLTLLIINYILMVAWVSKVGIVPPCWDLLTWLGLGTWDPMWIGPEGVGANQPVHSFLGGKGFGIQQGASLWVGSPKTRKGPPAFPG